MPLNFGDGVNKLGLARGRGAMRLLTRGPQKFGTNDRKGAQVPVEYGAADIHRVVLFLSPRARGRESVPPKTASLVPGTQDETTPDSGLVSSGDGRVSEVLRLAQGTGDREAGDVRPMASDGIQDVLAMEVAQTRPSGATERAPRIGIRDGP